MYPIMVQWQNEGQDRKNSGRKGKIQVILAHLDDHRDTVLYCHKKCIFYE